MGGTAGGSHHTYPRRTGHAAGGGHDRGGDQRRGDSSPTMIERPPIRVMPAELALKIAAGEVVERPASAVKELLDNALDADASRISIDIREAGLRGLRVTDDGHGIPRDQLPLAF